MIIAACWSIAFSFLSLFGLMGENEMSGFI
jgi:hypothetical protein